MSRNFYFFINQKQEIWECSRFSVEAETLQEAEAEAKKIYNAIDMPDEINVECEHILDTCQDISPKENDGQSTRELYSKDSGKLIIQNGTSIL